MFKGNSVRPMGRADSLAEIIQFARKELFGRSASLRIRKADGSFEELRI
ncbi:hypothetical protein ACP3TY_05665 [Pseudomonas rustica]